VFLRASLSAHGLPLRPVIFGVESGEWVADLRFDCLGDEKVTSAEYLCVMRAKQILVCSAISFFNER
jgi:hypothetical protein